MKVVFWVCANWNIQEIVEVEDNFFELDKDEQKDIISSWCKQVFPMFEYTDKAVTYGCLSVEDVFKQQKKEIKTLKNKIHQYKLLLENINKGLARIDKMNSRGNSTEILTTTVWLNDLITRVKGKIREL